MELVLERLRLYLVWFEWEPLSFLDIDLEDYKSWFVRYQFEMTEYFDQWRCKHSLPLMDLFVSTPCIRH